MARVKRYVKRRSQLGRYKQLFSPPSVSSEVQWRDCEVPVCVECMCVRFFTAYSVREVESGCHSGVQSCMISSVMCVRNVKGL